MRKYIQSFRLFFGNCPIRSMLIYLGITVGFVLFIAFLSLAGFGGGEDFFSGMIEGMSATIGVMTSLSGAMFLVGLYNYNLPEMPGYKYFRSIPDGAAAFRRAIVAGSVFSLLMGGIMTAIVSVLFLATGADITGVLLGVILLPIITGLMNFTGFLKCKVAKIAILSSTLCIVGFMAGFFSGSKEDDRTLSQILFAEPWVIYLAAGIAVVVFVGGLVYALLMSGRKWGGRACAK